MHRSVIYLDRLRIAMACIPLLVCFAGCDGTRPGEVEPVAEQTDPRALLEAAIAAGDWQSAERYTNAALIANPDDPDLITEVAKVNAFSNRKREAAKLLIEAAKLADYQPASRVDFAIRALVEVGEIYLAIELLEQSLKAHPDQNQQRRMLVGFLTELQRIDRIAPHLKRLIQDRDFDINLLVATSDTFTRRLSEKTPARLLERNPADHRVLLAEAFLFLYRHNASKAAEVLEDILQRHPGFAPAHAMYGQALALAERWSDLPEWHDKASAASRDFADFWLTLGDVALKQGRDAEAVKAYWKATRRDLNRSAAWDRLRVAIYRLREGNSEKHDSVSDEQLAIVSNHTKALLAFRESFNDFAGGGQNSQTAAEKVARDLLVLGRVWEAEAWSAIATTLPQDPSDRLANLRQEILQRLQNDKGWIAQDLPARTLDLSFLPDPELDLEWDAAPRASVIPNVATHEHVRLSERSQQWGLQGVGANNNPTDARLAALIRSTGVGGAAIDYDRDGFPDLMMMNSGGDMLEDNSQANQLMRNVGTTFLSVAHFARVNDRGYGQGVAVGDFNEDGFSDLFLANLGSNRLLRNNGDGTFTDCSEQLHERIDEPIHERWSTSAAFVDLNGDFVTDLLVTNYCRIVPKLDQPCLKKGVPGPCHPLTFPAEYDQFFANDPTGRLTDVTDQWVTRSSPGRGLGIVAGSLDGTNLGVFVANDMSRNAFYMRSDSEPTVLAESAAVRGVAVDGLTRAQASMGVASSDFDLDGDLDFYVTGFGREYNVYYEQILPGMWKDETGKLGLVEPTLPMIGFGTQAIDLDNDGIDEIIVTNGHIGKFDEPDAPPYELPLQLFRRGALGQFDLVEDDPWGTYFRNPHVGRALWTTDVNRDGHNDVMITHSDESICLLVNETRDDNRRIAFQLVATDCSRDAVGAVIRFKCNGQPRTLWRLSGDGYFCSNEKTLIAGLAQADQVTDVTVTWQDGSVDRLGTLDANRVYLITQGLGEAFEMLDYGKP